MVTSSNGTTRFRSPIFACLGPLRHLLDALTVGSAGFPTCIQFPSVGCFLAPCLATLSAEALLSSFAARTGDSRRRFPACVREGLDEADDEDADADVRGGGLSILLGRRVVGTCHSVICNLFRGCPHRNISKKKLFCLSFIQKPVSLLLQPTSMRMRCALLSSWDSAAMVRVLCKSNWVGTTRRVQCLCTAPCAVVFQDKSPFTGNRLTIFQPCVCVLLYTVALPGSGSCAHLKYDAEPVSLTFLASKNRLYDVHSSAIERATLKKI